MTPDELLARLLERLMPPYGADDLADFLERTESRFLETKDSGYGLTDAIVDVLEDKA